MFLSSSTNAILDIARFLYAAQLSFVFLSVIINLTERINPKVRITSPVGHISAII
tara:strand:- start:2307 stop:2471 length:165 start_codon:yes stop_codon:yes gene_type:complete